MQEVLKKIVERKIISEKDAKELQEEAKKSKGSFDEFLLAKQVVTEEQLMQMKSEIYDIPVCASDETFKIPNSVLSFIPEESARFYKIIPLALEENSLNVGIVDPDNIKTKEVLNFITRQHKLACKFFIISERIFKEYLKQYRNLKEEVDRALSELEGQFGDEDKNIELISGKLLPFQEKLTEEAPIIKMVAVILRHAVEGSASDIHIEPEEKQVRVRFRMDGTLYSSLFLPIQTHSSIVARIKIISNLRIDETRIPQDGRFSAKIDSKAIDFRVSTMPTKLGEKVVIRVLDPTEGLRTYEELGLSKSNLVILREAIDKPFGLILATGPTGSGKTTTLYAILQELNQPELNVITLEDPIEYFVKGVNQSQVRPEIGYDFGQGLRHIVRQDPDIIMVGEIRDEESASLVTHAALTGHIVLSTLHTNNAIGVIPRLIDMKIKPFLLPATLNIAIGQRLAQRLCPYCKEKVKPNPEIEKMIVKELNNIPENIKKDLKISSPFYVYRPKGCPKCNMKGEKGRIGVFEILKMTPELERIIIEDPTEANINKEAKRQDMITIRQDAVIKALMGEIAIEEIFRISEESYSY